MSYSSATAIRGLDAAQGSKGLVSGCLCCSLLMLHEDCHRARSLQRVPASWRREENLPSFIFLQRTAWGLGTAILKPERPLGSLVGLLKHRL